MTVFCKENTGSKQTSMTKPLTQEQLHQLHRLWSDRAKTIMQMATLLANSPEAERLRQFAAAFKQCAEELESPPVEIFRALEYDEADGPSPIQSSSASPEPNPPRNRDEGEWKTGDIAEAAHDITTGLLQGEVAIPKGTKLTVVGQSSNGLHPIAVKWGNNFCLAVSARELRRPTSESGQQP